MVNLTLARSCPTILGCEWASNYRKHWPARGVRKGETRHGPAKYLSGTSQSDIRLLETETVRAGTRAARGEHHLEYVRALDKVIGWDLGQDATTSFVECSGGASAGRTFHGRPVAERNRKTEERE